MKDIFSKSFMALVLVLTAACNDEFLDRNPIDKITNATYWNTESDLAVYNNSLYNIARIDWKIPIMMGHTEGFDSHFGNIWSIDELSDNMAPREPRHNFFQQIRAGKYNVPSSPDWFGYQGWDFVRAINIGLANYDRAKVSQAVKDKYIAEARLFRGWFYADKAQKYGDVPFVEKELAVDSEELYAARTPRAEAMQKVLEDLNFASQKLPDSWGDGNAPGRINRWGALLVKARVCLYEGTFNKYHSAGDSKMWLEEAAKAAAELMDKGPYRIYSTGKPQSDYNAYHRILDLAGNSEVIYWRKYKTGVINNHVQQYFSYTGGATKSLVEDYLCTDGLPITLSPLYKGDETIESTFENRDPRLRQTILHPEDTGLYKYHLADGRAYPMLEGMPGGGFKTTTGYHIIKHYNADDMIGKAYNTGESPAITLRLGEALLIYAEATAELGTISQSDLDKTINKLRDRVGMPHLLLSKVPADPRYTKDGISPIIAEIRRERRIELFMEGQRYSDLIRWKQGKKLEIPAMGVRWNDAAKKRFAGTTMKSEIDPVSGKEYIAVYKGTDYEIPVFDEKKHYLWPIPLNTLAQNPKIKQNPGWE